MGRRLGQICIQSRTSSTNNQIILTRVGSIATSINKLGQRFCLTGKRLKHHSTLWMEPRPCVITSPYYNHAPRLSPFQPQPAGTALLSLDSSQANVEGNYSCVAENLAGNSSRHVQVLVASE